MIKIQKGTIVKMHREPVTGASYLEIDDVDKGPTLVVCQGTPTAKAFDKVFGGVIVDGRFNGAAIAGKVIFYLLDPNGVFKSFLPIDQASPEEIEWFEQSRKATTAPETPKDLYGGPGTCTDLGLLPPDDKVYTRGPIVAGRPIFEPHRPSTAEEKAKNLQILREVAKGWRWVPVVPGTVGLAVHVYWLAFTNT